MSLSPLIAEQQPLRPDVLQRLASDPMKSVWVGASAGSGKTKVLADRVLRLLLCGVKPQRLLCLTFTRAAAAQMAIRVTEQLSKWATGSDDELRESLDRLQGMPPEPEQLSCARRLFAEVLNCPGGMRIRTIHAFGQEVLRRFPLEAGLPPQFSLLEDADEKALRKEVSDALFLEAAINKASAEGQALRLLGEELAEEGILKLLREVTDDPERLAACLDQAGGFDQLVMRQKTLLDLNPDDDDQTLVHKACLDESFDVESLRREAKILLTGAPTFARRGEAILAFCGMTITERVANFATYARQFVKADGELYASWIAAKIAAANPDLVPTMQTEGKRLMEVLAKIEALGWIDQMKAVLVLAHAFQKAYRHKKQTKAMLDYDDLIRTTANLLRRDNIASWVLYKLDGGIDHLMVDEAQDTSPAQWDIVSVLVEEFFNGLGALPERHRTLFVVGDEKQSIYSFLKADPEAFARMRAHFRERIMAVDADAYREVPMNISFRSAPAILRAVDHVFASGDARRGVSVVPVEHLAWHRDVPGRVEVWEPIASLKKKATKKTKKDEDEVDDDPEELWSVPVSYEREENTAVLLANRLADRIKGWLDAPLMLRGRPIDAGDIMVLVRRRNAFVDHLVRALKKKNVPVSGVDRMVLTNQLAVKDLLALLQFTLLPEDDLTLATVLRGPLVGLSEDDLMALALGRKGSLWHVLNQSQKFAAEAAYLTKWLGRVDQVSPFALLEEILGAACPADGLSGKKALWKRLGAEALDPINELLNAAQNFDQRHAVSLQSFLHWLMATEAEIKRELDQGGGAVRITTVHASKGLEAPIVILPDTTSLPNKQMMPKVLWHASASTHFSVPFYVPKTTSHPLLNSMRESLWQKQMEEYRRLLYVALTRAADRLYVCGYETERPDLTGQNWLALVSAALQPEDDEVYHEGDEKVVIADPVFQGDVSLVSQDDAKQVVEALPAWAYHEAPPESVPPRPLIPSRPSEPEPASLPPDDGRFARGLLIHRLLQSLPDLAPEKRRAAAEAFLANPQHLLPMAHQKEIVAEVMTLLETGAFTPLFGLESRAEVPLVGLCGDRLVSGQVDRLCMVGNEVWIVDYKTNRPPPLTDEGVPLVYKQQMEAYRMLLAQIYPAQKVRCFLLWTHVPRLMEIK